MIVAAALAGCAPAVVTGPPRATPGEVTDLARAIGALGPGVDPAEARHMALIAQDYPLELARAYGITDHPVVHNMKVNAGLRERGLCKDWADDLEARLTAEGFATLVLHRAIANADTWRLEHSTVVVSAPGQTMEDGIVLDPWRHGGDLFWSPMRSDPRYDWWPRERAFAYHRARDARG